MSEIKFRPYSSLNWQMRNTKYILKKLTQLQFMDMLTYYGHSKAPKKNTDFFYDFSLIVLL